MHYREIDLNTWKRRETYEYFRGFDSPFFNISANVDVTGLYQFCKEQKFSFFLASLFYSTLAANSVEEFRYRVRKNKLVCYNQVDPGCTIFLDDETFRYCYFNYSEDLRLFNEEGLSIIEKLKASPAFEPRVDKDDIIYYSVLPWVSFTSIEHAKKHNSADSIPRIVFGKYFKNNDRLLMPVSVQVNHAIMDGFHASKYFMDFEKRILSLPK